MLGSALFYFPPLWCRPFFLEYTIHTKTSQMYSSTLYVLRRVKTYIYLKTDFKNLLLIKLHYIFYRHAKREENGQANNFEQTLQFTPKIEDITRNNNLASKVDIILPLFGKNSGTLSSSFQDRIVNSGLLKFDSINTQR